MLSNIYYFSDLSNYLLLLLFNQKKIINKLKKEI
jgi:hypothetical protein